MIAMCDIEAWWIASANRKMVPLPVRLIMPELIREEDQSIAVITGQWFSVPTVNEVR